MDNETSGLHVYKIESENNFIMYGYNAEPPTAIPICTVLPYCVILGCKYEASELAIPMLLCPTTHILIQADLLTVPPGFERGMTFEPSVKGAPTSDLFPAPETVSISEVLFRGGEMVMEWGEGGEEEEEGGGGDITSKSTLQQVRPLPVSIGECVLS